MIESAAIPESTRRLVLGIGVISLVLCAFGWFLSPRSFFVAYLFAELVWLGIALGSMAFLMIHYLTGGKWGWPVRRFFEAAAGTLPLLGLLFVPIFFGLRYLYPWSDAGKVAADVVLQHKQSYMNPTLFVVRAVIVFGIWIWLSRRLIHLSLEQDTTTDPAPTKRVRRLSGPGLVIYPLTMTVASVDWIMSIEPDWYSTIFPILVCIGQMLSGLAFVIVVLYLLGERGTLSQIVSKENFHHLGSLLLAFTMLWAYMSFSQLLIIWSGDLPHEIAWYLHRIAGGWRWVVVFLVLFHFFGPFFLLLSRQTKQNRTYLAWVAGGMIFAHVVDVWWMIVPSFFPAGVHIDWLEFVTLLGIGGLWGTLFLHNLASRSLIPLNDPRFAVANVV